MLVFCDTSAIYALMVGSDEMHERSRAILEVLNDSHAALVTSSFVVQETIALLQSRVGLPAVRSFHDSVAPALEIDWVGPRIYERAMSSLLAAANRRISLTDWTSFELMRERRMEYAFAFDEHFEKQGFRVLSEREK